MDEKLDGWNGRTPDAWTYGRTGVRTVEGLDAWTPGRLDAQAPRPARPGTSPRGGVDNRIAIRAAVFRGSYPG